MPLLAASVTICILKPAFIWEMACFTTAVTGFLSVPGDARLRTLWTVVCEESEFSAVLTAAPAVFFCRVRTLLAADSIPKGNVWAFSNLRSCSESRRCCIDALLMRTPFYHVACRLEPLHRCKAQQGYKAPTRTRTLTLQAACILS